MHCNLRFIGALCSLLLLTACGGGSNEGIDRSIGDESFLMPANSLSSHSSKKSSSHSSIKSSMASSVLSSKASSLVSSTVKSSSSQAAGGVVSTRTKTSHNAGLDCSSCHKAGTAAGAKAIFAVSGTVYKSSGAIQPSATVNLYLHLTNNLNASLVTDMSGNFYTTQPVMGLSVNGEVVIGIDPVVEGPTGVLHNMPGLITTGACNGCHGISSGKIIGD